MLAWRKKPEGFEWHKHIRTTVKLRREARRERVDEARRAAGEQMNHAGAALAAGSRAAGSAARDGTIAAVGGVALFLQNALSLAWHAVRVAASIVWDAMGIAAGALFAILSRPNVGGPVVLAGAIALGAGIGRARGVGLDGEAIATLTIGVVLMAALVPLLLAVTTWRLPQIAGLNGKTAGIAAGLVVLVGGAAWFASGGGLGSMAGMASIPLIGGGKSVEGRASTRGADTLRVAGTTIRLAGISVPETDQRCGRHRCAAAAEAALSRFVRGRNLSCSISGTDGAGRSLGKCSIGNTDIAAELVRQGYVFAENGILASYASQEREARAAKVGAWARTSGRVQR